MYTRFLIKPEYHHELRKSMYIHISGYIAVTFITTLVHVSVITLHSFTEAATYVAASYQHCTTVQLDLNLSKNRVWCCTHTQYVQFQPRLALRVHAKLLTRILLAGTSRVSTRVPDVPSRACIIEYLKRMQHESICARELSL